MSVLGLSSLLGWLIEYEFVGGGVVLWGSFFFGRKCLRTIPISTSNGISPRLIFFFLFPCYISLLIILLDFCSFFKKRICFLDFDL